MSNRRDRIMTIMMVPFMSCGARMPVFALFAVAFFPAGGQNIVFLLYLLGIAVAIMTGFLLKTLFSKVMFRLSLWRCRLGTFRPSRGFSSGYGIV